MQEVVHVLCVKLKLYNVCPTRDFPDYGIQITTYGVGDAVTP